MGEEDSSVALLYIPDFYTDDLAFIRLIAKADSRAVYLVDCANNSLKKDFKPPEYKQEPLDNVFLTNAKSMRSYNELLTALKADFHADEFVSGLHNLDYAQLCCITIPAVKGLQSSVNRYFGFQRKEHSLIIDAIRINEPNSKQKNQTIKSMIRFSEEVKKSSLCIMANYDDDYTKEDDDGTWTIGGCAHAYILAGLLRKENASKNDLALEFIRHNRERIYASYVQHMVIRAFRIFAGSDLLRWCRLLGFVGYREEVPLRGDVIGLPFGMVLLEKRSHKRRASAWYSAPLTANDTFEASCLLCGRPFPKRVKWGELLGGRVFSCGCSAPKTMYPPALQRLKAAAIQRFQAKRSECSSEAKAFGFTSEDDFLESVGLPWSHDCLDLSRVNDHRYENVPYAPGSVFWECASSNRARGGKATKRKRLVLPVGCNESKMPYVMSAIARYEHAPGFHERPNLDTWRREYGQFRGTRDENHRIKLSIKSDS